MSNLKKQLIAVPGYIVIVGASLLVVSPVRAASFTTTVFATGGAVGANSPDSVTFGNNSLWVEYGNGASSTGGSGSTTIVQYGLNGSVLHAYTIAGSVDGLKYNPNTGQVWALQNQDANSTLTIINPTTGTTSSFTYGALYNSMSGTRGLDDVVFNGSQTFMSVTNPASGTDPVVVQLTNLVSPLLQSAILTMGATGTNRATGSTGPIPATDPDSLKLGPNGSLILTGEGDHALMFINNPGQAGQSVSFLNLVNAVGGMTGGQKGAVIGAIAGASGAYVIDQIVQHQAAKARQANADNYRDNYRDNPQPNDREPQHFKERVPPQPMR